MKSTENLDKSFGDLFETCSSEKFLKMDGLSGEVPFFIFPFHPSLQEDVDQRVPHLINKLKTNGVSVLEINLFQLCLDLMKERKRYDRIIANEPSMPKQRFLGTMNTLLSEEKQLKPAIGNMVKNAEFQILFLTGVGLVYPFVRSHKILNNIQREVKHQPTVIFFPGEYTFSQENGSALELFGRLKDNKYYRAFNLKEYSLS
jgi:hypothetical protein